MSPSLSTKLSLLAKGAVLLGVSATSAPAVPQLHRVWRQDLPGNVTTAHIAARPNGDLIVACNRGASAWLFAFDALGQPQWDVPVTGTLLRGVDILLDGTTVVLTALAGDFHVMRYSTAGVFLGEASYGGSSNDVGAAIVAHPDGGYAVAGWTISPDYGTPLPTTSGTRDAFVAKHTAAGVESWARRFDVGSTSESYFVDLVARANGMIYACGYRFDSLNSYTFRASVTLSAAGSPVIPFISTGSFGSFLEVTETRGGRTLRTSQYPDSGGWGNGAGLRSTDLQGAFWETGLGSGMFVSSTMERAVGDGDGGAYAWVVDATPTWVFAPVFVGVVRYGATGQELWRSATPEKPTTVAELPFGDIGAVFLGPVPYVERLSAAQVGTQSCAGQPNSSGAPAVLRLTGSPSAQQNELLLFANGVPALAPSLTAVSFSTGFVPNLAGGFGDLCLGAPIGRGPVYAASPFGTVIHRFDLAALPGPNGPQAAVAGDTLVFQIWYRDSVGGAATTNLTSAASIVLQ